MKFLGLLFIALVTVCAQYISHNGHDLLNHTYLNLSQVGNTTSRSVSCWTNYLSCCMVFHREQGGWYLPSGLIFWGSISTPDIYVEHGYQEVRLIRKNNANRPSGIYRCDIPTSTSVMQSLYLGLYYDSGGDIIISSLIVFSEISNINGEHPQFTLTCISTGGPATSVTWTINHRPATGTQFISVSQLDDRETAQYTHTLTVTGLFGGDYRCTVTNAKPSSASQTYYITVASPPTAVRADPEGLTSIRVSWTLSSTLEDTTGYVISIAGSSSDRSVNVSSRFTNYYVVTGLQNGGIYTISVVARSLHFYSHSVTARQSVRLLPGTPTIIIERTDTTSISLSLSTPSGSVVTSYYVTWVSDACPGVDDEGISTIFSSYYVISNRRAGTKYSITASAVNLAGTSSPTTTAATTPVSTPSAAPTLVKVSIVNATAISVQWREVECLYHNGILTGYSVRYWQVGNLGRQTRTVNRRRTINIYELSAVTGYTVDVAARNSAGTGVYSDPVTFTTPDYQYFSLNGDIIPNNGYVVISDIGYSDNSALICHTDRSPDDGDSNSGGDWFTSTGNRVGQLPTGVDTGFRKSKAPYIIRLKRRRDTTTTPVEGIYECLIKDSTNKLVVLNVGVYQTGYGSVSISDTMLFTVDSDLNGCSPKFTLTCISTGGPATTVTWTRNSATITEDANTVLDDTVTPQYTHTLTVTGRREGVYTCTVANNKPSSDFRQLHVTAPSPPTDVTVFQNGVGSLLVSWGSAQGDSNVVTGYTIFYQGSDGGKGSSINAESTYATIAQLVVGATYSVTVIANSALLTSVESKERHKTIKPFAINITSSASSSVVAGQRAILTCTVILPTEFELTNSLNMFWEKPDNSRDRADNTMTSGGMVSSELSIRKIATSQAGEYTCSVTLIGTSRTSTHITVQIPVLQPTLRASGTNRIAGTPLSLICQYSKSPSVDTPIDIVISWIVNCSNVAISQDRISTEDNTLAFSPLDTLDTGRYICVLNITSLKVHVTQQQPNQSIEMAINVQDLYAPVVTISGNTTSIAGEELHLMCEMTTVDDLIGSTRRDTQWSSEVIDVSNITNNGITSARLTFSPLSTLHAAEYTCQGVVHIRAINLTRTKRQSISLIVQIPIPVMELSAYELLIQSGSPLSLNCTIQPSLVDTPTILTSSWTAPNSTHNVTYPVSNTSIELMIDSVETTDSGDYICTAGMIDASGSNYIIDSETANDVININVYLYFKIHMSGEISCSRANESEMVEDITDAILSVLNSSFLEYIPYEIIDMQSLKCHAHSPAHMIYSARLKSSSETDSGSLISPIEEWVREGPSINVTGVLMTVNSECKVVTSSLNDTLCPTETISSRPIIYTVIATVAGVLVASIAATVTVILYYVYKKRHGKNIHNKLLIDSGRTKRVYDGVDYDEPGEKVTDIPEMLTDEAVETAIPLKDISVTSNSAYHRRNTEGKHECTYYDDIVITEKSKPEQTSVQCDSSSGKEEVVYATVNHEKRRGRVKAKDTPIKVFNNVPETEVLYSSFKTRDRDITVVPNSAYEVETKKKEESKDDAESIYDDIVTSKKTEQTHVQCDTPSGRQEVVYATVNHEKRRGKVQAKDIPIKDVPETEVPYSSFKTKDRDITVVPNSAYEVETMKKLESMDEEDECIYDDIVTSKKRSCPVQLEGDQTTTDTVGRLKQHGKQSGGEDPMYDLVEDEKAGQPGKAHKKSFIPTPYLLPQHKTQLPVTPPTVIRAKEE